MNSLVSKLLPIFLIFMGVLVLFAFNMGIVAGVSILVGIVIIIERLFPEKWGRDEMFRDTI